MAGQRNIQQNGIRQNDNQHSKKHDSKHDRMTTLGAEHPKSAFTLANFAHDFALSLHVLLKKISLLNVQT
jgi:hypothetical protein